MAAQATMVLIKPDAIQRGLIGAVLSKLEPLQLEVIGAKVVRVGRALAEAHYQDIRERPFFEETVKYLQGALHGISYVVAVVFWGEDAVERVRQVAGATNPEHATPHSIRGALGRITTAGLMENILHTSSDPGEAEREIGLWFQPRELLRTVGPAASAATPKSTR